MAPGRQGRDGECGGCGRDPGAGDETGDRGMGIRHMDVLGQWEYPGIVYGHIQRPGTCRRKRKTWNEIYAVQRIGKSDNGADPFTPVQKHDRRPAGRGRERRAAGATVHLLAARDGVHRALRINGRLRRLVLIRLL